MPLGGHLRTHLIFSQMTIVSSPYRQCGAKRVIKGLKRNPDLKHLDYGADEVLLGKARPSVTNVSPLLASRLKNDLDVCVGTPEKQIRTCWLSSRFKVSLCT